MGKWLRIWIIIVGYFIACGKSCTDDSSRAAWEEKQVEMARDSIRLEFEAGYLSEEARFAAEKSAIQKLGDLADYIKIYTDDAMDPTFREKAGYMIRGLFISEDCKLTFAREEQNKKKSTTLGNFIEKGFGPDILQIEIIFDSLRGWEPLHKSGEELYTGKLAARQTVIMHRHADSMFSTSLPVVVQFISSKRVKIIGQDTLKVWEVSLGDMVQIR